MLIDGIWWLSTLRMTVGCIVEDGKIIDRDISPIICRFIGQPFDNLRRWLRKQGEYREHKYENHR